MNFAEPGKAPKTAAIASTRGKTPLSRQQIIGFWAAWSGWMLDGMDSVIYALVLGAALTELLPRSGIEATPGNIGFAGSVMFALFLVGWGLSFIWGPIADRFGRTKSLAATILIYSVFTGAAALSDNIWQLALFRFLAGIGVGGEWAMAGTYIAEAWPEDRRKMGAGYLQTGYYFGFFVAAVLNYTIGSSFGWRAMFLCGLAPVIVSLVTLFQVHEPDRWAKTRQGGPSQKLRPLATLFSRPYRQRTIVMSALLTVAIVGLWAGAVYEPTAIIFLAKRRHVGRRGSPDSLLGHGAPLDRHNPGMHHPANDRRAARASRHIGHLFLRHDADDCARLRLGFLPAARHRSAGLSRRTLFSRRRRRQFCHLQPLAARTLRHARAGNCLRLLHFGRPLHRRGGEFRFGRGG
jgi:MFS transporter